MRIANKDVSFVINSNARFYDKTLPRILPSLFGAGVLRDSVVVVIGGFDDEQQAAAVAKQVQSEWSVLSVNTPALDSCDYTTFNFVLDSPETFASFDYLFYLHDTSWVGPDFVHQLRLLTPKHEVDSYGLTPSWSMNIGLYRIGHLLALPNRVRESLNTSNSPASINERKQWGALHEDYLMNKAHGNYLSADSHEETTFENPYDSNTTRRTRHFRCLDLYKSQSNWNGVQSQMSVML